MSPLSGRVSTLMTGIFFSFSVLSDSAIAPVSCGAITTALAPWSVKVWTLATSLPMSFCELVSGSALTSPALTPFST